MEIWFELGSVTLTLVVLAVLMAATALGLWLGRRLRDRSDRFREAVNVVQVALFGFLGLLLAFSLSLAIGRYEERRQAVVDEANAIGTSYLRAQTLPEPLRSEAVALLTRYADDRIALSGAVPGSARFEAASVDAEGLHGDLWSTATRALAAAPQDSAPRLYAESLNTTIDLHTTRLASLGNRMPSSVVYLELIVSATALALLGLYVSLTEHGRATVVLAAAMVAMILLVTFDLDRPVRGLITVPSGPLVDVRAFMDRLVQPR